METFFQQFDWNGLLSLLGRVAGVFLCLTVHETCHGLAACALGDPTAKRMHRLSLNPLHHIDWLGLASMVVCGFGWAKPVPIAAVTRFRHPRRDMALSAAAGPASNFVLAFFCMIFYKLVYYLAPIAAAWDFAAAVLFQLVWTNITLAVFNLLPVPPLDGSRVVTAFLPQQAYFGLMRYERYIMLALFAALMLGWLDTPLRVVDNAVWTFLVYATQFVEWILRPLLI